MFHDVWDSWPSVEKVSPCVQWHWADHNTFKMFSNKDDNSSRWIADTYAWVCCAQIKCYDVGEYGSVNYYVVRYRPTPVTMAECTIGSGGGIGTRIILNHSLNWHPWTIFGSSFSCVIIQIAADIHSSILIWSKSGCQIIMHTWHIKGRLRRLVTS